MSGFAGVEPLRRTFCLVLVAVLLGACASASAAPPPTTPGSTADAPRRCSSAAAASGKIFVGVDAAVEGASAGTAGLGYVPDAVRKAATVRVGATAEASLSTPSASAGFSRLATVPSSATRAFERGSAPETCG